jgi:hypothetical protein
MPKEQIPQTLAILCDPNVSDEQKLEACRNIEALHSNVDRRRVVPVLIKLLYSNNEHLRLAVCMILGYLGSKRAVEPLLKIAANQAEQPYIRGEAIRALSYADDERVTAVLQPLMFDTTENIEVRCLAIEWSRRTEGMLDTWIRLLSDELPDIRFWAAYRLTQAWTDIRPARAALDHVAAYDHTVPQTWGWYVDREALYALEQIYSIPYRQRKYDEPDIANLPGYRMYLVSPTIEYGDFAHGYRRYNGTDFYETPPELPVNFRVDPSWLKGEILQAFPHAIFDVRQPKPETYLLDWYLQIDGQDLLGGLHRDQYALILTGKNEAVFTFGAWYRQVIAPEQRLHLFAWADPGVELLPGISAEEIGEATKNVYETWKFNLAKYT